MFAVVELVVVGFIVVGFVGTLCNSGLGWVVLRFVVWVRCLLCWCCRFVGYGVGAVSTVVGLVV